MGSKNAYVLSGMKVGSVSHTDFHLVCVIIKAFKQHLPLLCAAGIFADLGLDVVLILDGEQEFKML